MTSDKVNIAMLSLLRAGLWNRSLDDCSPFPLSDDEWEVLYDESCRQTIQGYVFDGIKKLKADFAPSREVLAKWLVHKRMLSVKNERMNETVASLFRDFTSEGIFPVLLKGQGNAAMYESPLSRVAGDIDLWFRNPDEYDKAVVLASSSNCHISEDSDNDVHFVHNGLPVEFHRTWIQLSSPSAIRRLKELESDPDFIRPVGGYRTLSALPNLLLLNLHILKHALIMGVGWRQLCDMAMAYHTYKGQYDATKYINLLNELHLYRWTLMLNRTLVDELGLPSVAVPCCSSTPRHSLALTKIIRESGDMGLHTGTKSYVRLSGSVKYRYILKRISHKLYFSLEYAPAELFWRLFFLMKNRMCHVFK